MGSARLPRPGSRLCKVGSRLPGHLLPVRWPMRRHNLVWTLYQLANPVFQSEKWLAGQSDGSGNMYGFALVINFFFDDTELGEHPEGTVGDILLDELEVSAVRHVGKALDVVYNSVGPRKPDAEYIASHKWRDVVTAAVKAYRLLRPRVFAEGDSLLPPELPRRGTQNSPTAAKG